MRSESKTALVLGAGGGVGSEITRALLRHGWQVRALVRRMPNAECVPHHPQVEWHVGDAMRRSDVIDASLGMSVLVHAVNPANYHDWRGLALPMLDHTIAAASITRATVVLPGNIYNYGLDAAPTLREDSPQHPHTHKGAVRVEMEERLRDASWDRIRALVIRAGDFFGPRATSSWLSQGVVRARNPIRWAFNPGPRNQYHSWAYLPDVAETVARLLPQRQSMPAFDTYHFKGHFLRNSEMTQAVCQAAGISVRRVLPLPWWAIRATAPFVEVCREMIEMRYLWEHPFELSNDKLLARLGGEPHTPLAEALRTTFIGIGCIANSAPLTTQAPV